MCLAVLVGSSAVALPQKSINSTSQNSGKQPVTPVAERPFQGLSGYQIVASNDLGMHCGDIDQRVASILPPFNVVHAQVLKKGHTPLLLDQSQTGVYYSAASNPLDPSLAYAVPPIVYKTNFWDINPRTGKPVAYDAMNAYYPPGILGLFPIAPDVGLPVPDLQRLYLGDGKLAADQQWMPSVTAPFVSQPYSLNIPQPFALFYKSLPFFINFPFGYTQTSVNWFSAEGIPVSPFDDNGRLNAYPLMRVQAMASKGNTLQLAAGTVLASLDVVTPVSGEVDCKNCHSAISDGGNGSAIRGISPATRVDDPLYTKVPTAVSIEYAFDLNILRLHDLKHGTNLQNETPVSCQRCHYTPALDLAHVGPKGPGADANGREQTLHQSFSRVMHGYHARVVRFPSMPGPTGRSAATRDDILQKTCYQCHPGKVTQCFRGEMYNAGQACQDCHGNLQQVANDFSQNVSAGNPGKFIVAGDYYTNPKTPRIPWANEPMCQSCHTGDINSNLTALSGTVKSSDGLRLAQAYRTGDANAKPIVAVNRRFSENQVASQTGTKQVLFRLSRGHGGVFCEGCHGATHAEWPNANPAANDNVAANQLQGHSGKIVECQTCHGVGTLTLSDFRGNLDANGWMKGPHGMHPVDARWVSDHHDMVGDSSSSMGVCQACHGKNLQGTVLSKAATSRTFSHDGRTFTIAKGAVVGCALCHENPLNNN